MARHVHGDAEIFQLQAGMFNKLFNVVMLKRHFIEHCGS